MRAKHRKTEETLTKLFSSEPSTAMTVTSLSHTHSNRSSVAPHALDTRHKRADRVCEFLYVKEVCVLLNMREAPPTARYRDELEYLSTRKWEQWSIMKTVLQNISFFISWLPVFHLTFTSHLQIEKSWNKELKGSLRLTLKFSQYKEWIKWNKMIFHALVFQLRWCQKIFPWIEIHPESNCESSWEFAVTRDRVHKHFMETFITPFRERTVLTNHCLQINTHRLIFICWFLAESGSCLDGQQSVGVKVQFLVSRPETLGRHTDAQLSKTPCFGRGEHDGHTQNKKIQACESAHITQISLESKLCDCTIILQ